MQIHIYTFIKSKCNPLLLSFQTQLTMMCLGLQSCVLVIWTPMEHLELDILFDQKYTEAQMKHLQNFYFSHMLPRLVDDFFGKKDYALPHLDLVK